MMTIKSPTDEIAAAKARYCRFIDTKQWEAFAALLAEAPKIRMLGPDGDLLFAFDERDAFVALSSQFLAKGRSIHQVHNAEIEEIADGRVAAVWSMEDLIVFPDAAPGETARMNGYGHYHEIWERGPDGWRIAELELRRTILDITQA